MHKRGIEGGVLEVNCPYCQSANYVKRGLRQKKLETIQLYLCNDCRRTFTPKAIKGKRYPLSTILNAISLYNLGYSLEKVCQGISQIGRLAAEATGALSANPKGTKDAISAGTSVKNEGNIGVGTLGSVTASTVSNWIAQFAPLCRFLRFRGYALQKFRIKDFIETVTLAHRQLYRFRYHRAKMAMMMLDDFRHRKFKPLEEFLEMVSSECPHQYFQEGLRASEVPLFFSKKEMIVRGKENYATRLAKFVLESVGKNRDRHEALQKFMLINDSVTVATEVPVYLRVEDLTHMQTQLGFKLYSKPDKKISRRPAAEIEQAFGEQSQKRQNATSDATISEEKIMSELGREELPRLITGHIDILQVRNGLVHILDYKPKAEKERPVEQLVLYALALSRLTGLRLFNFKCAWFDEKDYFEFYPLHAVYKLNRKRSKIKTIEGEYPMNQRADKFDSIRPTDYTGEKRGPPKNTALNPSRQNT